jgi:peptide/nickel transport system permease protein
MVLPIVCMSLHSLSFLSRQIQGAVTTALQAEYIKTATAKGLSYKTTIWRHAFRNALFPMITILGNMLPHLVVGSFVVEIIFNIPGMGREAFSAFNRQDYPVLYAITMCAAFMTLLGNLLADTLFRLADPRIV